ncbi:hypothetical protein T492DRAFT_1059909 [Pavlovales sp. CCMP2436]|nr:hypothetical protein T492DRAFT_1059909 [Pavlovales sp. CCMP2436]
MAFHQSETDGEEGGVPPMRRAADVLEPGYRQKCFAFGPLAVALFSLSLEAIGVVAVSTASAVWYLEMGYWESVDTRGIPTYNFDPFILLAAALTILLPYFLIPWLLALTMTNAYEARASQRLQDHGVHVMLDANSGISRGVYVSILLLVLQVLLVGIAAVFDHKRGGMSIFEVFAKWGAIAAVSALLIVRIWETASAKPSLLGLESITDDASLVQYQQMLNNIVLVREGALSSWLSYNAIIAREFYARQKANKKTPLRTWAHPIELPKLDFMTIVDQVNKTPKLFEELSVVLEATKMPKLNSFRGGNGGARGDQWAGAFSRAADAGDIAFNKAVVGITILALIAFIVAFFGSVGWYLSGLGW